MWYQQQSEDYRPLFWVSGRPVYANTLLVFLHVLSLVICALCVSSMGLATVYNALSLSPSRIWHGEVWRLVSYAAFLPSFFSPGGPFLFLWSMVILYFCGREVEQFVGRRSYLGLYAALLFVPSVLFWLAGPILGLSGYLSCSEVIFGVFVAFATIYPGAMPSMWVTIPVWILAWIFFGIYMLFYFAMHDNAAMFMLVMNSGVAYLTMRWMGAGRGLNWLTDWMETRRAERLARQHHIKVITEKKSAESIDAILDKISRQGVNSLTSSERAALERVRTKLIDRDRG
jgi:hypothetical protein